MFLFQLFCFELWRASHYCTRSSRARVERVSSASRARASVNLCVDGTVAYMNQFDCTCIIDGLSDASLTSSLTALEAEGQTELMFGKVALRGACYSCLL